MNMTEQETGWWSQELRELRRDVTAIREKVYNGYSESLSKLTDVQKQQGEALKELSTIVHDLDKRTQAQENFAVYGEQNTARRWRRLAIGATVLMAVVGVVGLLI
jgi:ABC-type molybdenum transport system ATPase subunit/photorepair protein PhrA